MTVPKYSDYLRRELEENDKLTTEQRMQLLKMLGKIESQKLANKKLEIKGKVGRHYGPPLKPKPLVELPPAKQDAPPAKPMGQVVDEALADYKRSTEEKQDGSGKQHEHSGPVGQPAEEPASGEYGA